MRTFIAVPLPPEVRVGLEKMQEELKAADADVRWTAVASIHLTLKFLGEIDPKSVPRLAELLREATAGERSFSLRVRGLGAFPNLRSPRVVWCGVEGEMERLEGLQEKVETACQSAGFPPEDRPFKPHLTLGRVRSKRNLQGLAEYIKIGTDFEAAVAVNGFHIYESILRPQGALYNVLETVALTG